jgi:type 1 fimbria pilin
MEALFVAVASWRVGIDNRATAVEACLRTMSNVAALAGVIQRDSSLRGRRRPSVQGPAGACGAGRRRSVPSIVVICVGASLLYPALHATAGCSRTADLGAVSVSFPAAISISSNAPVGTVISRVTVPVPGATSGFKFASCTGTEPMYWAIRDGPVVANRVGTTSVPGVGYTSSISGGGFSGDIAMDSSWSSSAAPGGGTSPTFQSQLYVTVNLVVTGPVSSGSLSVNPSGGAGIKNQVAAFFVNYSGTMLFTAVLAANSSAIIASACNVTTPSIVVDLPTVSSSAFRQIGDTAGARTTAINLTCPSSAIRVFVTLTDNTNPTNTSNTLTLKPDSTAQGVGLQILNEAGPVSFGSDSAAAGNTNQWFAGTSNSGTVLIPLVVRYVQTAAQVRPGGVKGVATFTMSYQ